MGTSCFSGPFAAAQFPRFYSSGRACWTLGLRQPADRDLILSNRETALLWQLCTTQALRGSVSIVDHETSLIASAYSSILNHSRSAAVGTWRMVTTPWRHFEPHEKCRLKETQQTRSFRATGILCTGFMRGALFKSITHARIRPWQIVPLLQGVSLRGTLGFNTGVSAFILR